MKRVLTIVIAGALMLGVNIEASSARDYISIVGSSTVYPFATVVAERFGKTTNFKTPTIESTGSGGGLKLFCAGVGVEHPDIANASRKIKTSECETCAENGVKEIIEVKIGYDGIVIANSKSAPVMKLTRQDLFLALAKEVPDPSGGDALVPNPYQTWKQVNGSLPDNKIVVLGPPPTSGTRDAFVELVMESGAESFDSIKALKDSDKDRFKAVSQTVREDGAYVEAGENDNLIVQKLEKDPAALGIFGFSFLDQNADKMQGAFVDDVEPTFENIASGDYPVSRPLYFYVKKAHIGTIPGIQEYLATFSDEKAWGPEGYLSDKGLIPMPDDEREKFSKDISELTPMQCK
jgi:phosphate transport system substrate-binding protein